jgi:hypothetical protein
MLRVMQAIAQEKLQEVVAVVVTMQEESRLSEERILEEMILEARMLAAVVVEEQQLGLAAMMVREMVHEREVAREGWKEE